MMPVPADDLSIPEFLRRPAAEPTGTKEADDMARKPRQSKQTNGIDPEIAKAYVGRVENLHADLEAKKGAYMAACKGVREDIKELYSEAKANGVPPKALKAEVKSREYDRKKAKLKDGLDIDDLSAFEQLQEALEGIVDLPLGQAAMDAQRRRDSTEFDEVEREVEDRGIRNAVNDELNGGAMPEPASEPVAA